MLVSKALLSTNVVASKDDSRPLLTCIKLYKEEGAIVSVATNGYILGEVIEMTPAVDEYPELPAIGERVLADVVMLPAKSAKTLSKAIKKNDTGLPILSYALVEEERESTTDLETVTTLGFHKTEGNYPEYRKLIPEYTDKNSVTITLNPEYLKQVLEMFKGDNSISLVVSTGEKSKLDPVILTSNAYGVKKTGVVMPLKS